MEKFLAANCKSSPIVISGISGRFPRSRNLNELATNLYSQVDLIDDDESRWKHFNPELPRRFGKISGLEKFDASFFSYLDKHAATMDPQARMLLEHSYEAILDAGVCPDSIIGSKTGVFVACMASDSKDAFFDHIPTKDGLSMFGNSLFYLSNRISYVLGLCGPSMTMDTACSGSAYALNSALQSINAGECDAALVAGTNLILGQNVTTSYKRAGFLSNDGESRPFDENASGYVRSESVCVMFLQKAKDSKRNYAEVVHVRTNNDGFKEEGSSFPSSKMQERLMSEFYDDIDVDPSEIEFVEAHSTGTHVGDPQEVKAIDKVFCIGKNRDKPLIIGSVKSNLGHCEAAAGITSIAKVLLTFENRCFPPNINLMNLRTNIDAFTKNRVKVATEAEKFDGKLISINSFGAGGANAHILLKANQKEKTSHGVPNDNLNRLIVWSGRTTEALDSVFDGICERPLDAELVALLQSSQVQTNIANNVRGFGIFAHDEDFSQAVCVDKKVQNFTGPHRPVVWVFSGMGSQWPGMVSDLMLIPTFAESIERSHEILLTKKVNLKQIIGDGDSCTFSSALNSYVGIVSIEIALTDVLTSLGLKPDFIIGHSVGELGCAYADGCMTAKETILAAYTRGSVAVESTTIKGAMAAVGLHYKEVLKILPDTIDIACHNGSDSTTISGPAEQIKAFLAKLTSENIFGKEVACSGVPFHSRYISNMGNMLLTKLKTTIMNPQRRSSKWLSSTYDRIQWGEAESQFSSAEYHTRNLLSPVLFEEVCKMLPSNSICIEVGPHGLLQSIMKMNLNNGIHLSMMQRGNANGCDRVMKTLGELFLNGVDIDIAKLYLPVEFPVSRGTPMIAPFLKWNHDIDHFVPYLNTFIEFSRRNLTINLSDKKFEFIAGHVIDHKVLFPASGWITYVWETYAMMLGKPQSSLSVEMHNVKFLRATVLTSNLDVHVTIVIHRASGKFEVSEDDETLCEGVIKAADDTKMAQISSVCSNDEVVLQGHEVRKLFKLSGHYYHGAFQNLRRLNCDQTKGKLLWKSNWITFIDAMIVNSISLKLTASTLSVGIRKVVINPKLHFAMIDELKNDSEIELDLKMCLFTKVIQSGGVELHGCEIKSLEKRRLHDATLEKFRFVPFFPKEKLSKSDSVSVFLQLVQDNLLAKKLKVVEIDSSDDENLLSVEIVKAAASQPGLSVDMKVLSSRSYKLEGIEIVDGNISQFSDVNMIVMKRLTEHTFTSEIKSISMTNCFVVCKQADLTNLNFNVISKLQVEDGFLLLCQLKSSQSDKFAVTQINDNNEEWIGKLKINLNLAPTLAVSNDNTSGILGLINCIRKESIGDNLKCFLMIDKNVPKFQVDDQFYKPQIELGLATNVYKDGMWGAYRYLDLEENVARKPIKEHCHAECIEKGDLSSILWVQGPLAVDHTQNLVKVHFSALNLRDIMLATGKITFEKKGDAIGCEVSGVTSNGQRIMGTGTRHSMMSSHCTTKDLIWWKVPNDWTLEQAATVPVAYLTVYCAFFKCAKIESAKTILIHAASGGVGQAAVQVALSYDLEVFATVSTKEKKEFLLKKFPKLKDINIGSSRDDSFEQMVQLNTNGKGVDFVLNCLVGELLQASLRCVSLNGTFVEIGKFDIQNNSKIHLGHFTKQIKFCSLMIDELDSSSADVKFVRNLIEKDIELGIVQPIVSRVFDASEIQDAFEFMAKGKHIGKILLKIREHEHETFPIRMISRVHCSEEESVIIVGGLGGFGLELAGWLVSRGCRKLVLCGRSGVTNGYQALRISQWKSRGVEVLISKSDVTSKSECERLIDEAIKLGRVGGIFNLAAVLRDKIFENQTVETFREVLRPKVKVTKYMDEITRAKCLDLKHFVVFSSLSCGRGNAGQSNYGMANSICERIIELRHREGLPAKAIQWGAIGDVGLLAKAQAANMNIKVAGTVPQEIRSCFEVLDAMLTSDEPVVSSMVVAKDASSKNITKNILNDLLSILNVKTDESSVFEKPLSKFRIDSLTTVEIQQLLERDYETMISSSLLRSLSIIQIKERVESVTTNEALSDRSLLLDDLIMIANIFGDENDVDKVVVKANDVEQLDLPIVVIIPAIFGSASDVFYKLAKSLKYPSFILQLHKTAHCIDLDELVELVKQDVLECVTSRNFILIGHSFGAVIGLKLASFLESHGKSGHFVSVDGSPKWSHQLTKQIVNVVGKDEALWTIATKFFIKIAFLGEAKSVVKKVFNEPTWDLRVERLYDIVKTRFSFSFQYFEKKILVAFVNRIRMLININEYLFPVLKKIRITLFRASENVLEYIEEDYGLNEQSIFPITNKVAEGNHLNIISDKEISATVNNLY